ncbi:MAG: tyrosine--tRNA ligase [Dehalococcoidales bacterium]|nr:tyrosine--tRNA ligase [Dehalococcoidales bacterium]
MSNVFDEFQWRGQVYEVTEGLRESFENEKVTAYIGFDPTAPSLHAGNLLTVMGLVRIQQYGHTPIAVAGGGTGLIGDPKMSSERPMISKDEVLSNLEGIKEQLGRFLDFDSKTNPAIMVNNADWLTTTSLTDFLRDVGKHFSVNNMIAKETVKRRLEGEGISYTEFSYLLLQSFDYLKLFEKYKCTLQMGGSDQWGNITSGVDLIRKVHGAKAHALVWPLLMNANGTKFGKSEGGAIWLDAGRTSPYRFYQFWINADDKDVINYLKYLTLLTQPEIEALASSLENQPEKREAQKALAREVTRFVHGQDALDKAEKASRILFGEEISGLGLQDVLDIFAGVPSVQIESARITGEGMGIADLVASSGLTQSKGEARRLVQSGGIYLNNQRINDLKFMVTIEIAVEGQALVLRKGQKEYRLVKINRE